MRRLFLVSLLLTIACRGSRDATPHRDLPLANAQPQSPDTGRRSPARAELRGNCITPGTAALRGTVRREIQLGAPGYGETPKKDRRDTIAVLILPSALTLCRDSTDRFPPVHSRRVALRAVPREILNYVSRPITVFGTLGEASFAWEYGPLVMWVDSVPALREPPSVRVATHVSPNERRR